MTASVDTKRSWARALHEMFEASLFLKAALALAEVVAGLSLILLPHSQFSAIAGWLARYDIAHDRHEWPLRMLERGLAGFSIESQHFYALYLTLHGVLKLVMVTLLVRKVSWAYPAAMVILATFVAYQGQEWLRTGSVPLLVLTVFDGMVFALVWREYRVLRVARGPA